ncbi:hypothetical protein Cob_v000271 [Colletotrichum orbiculare MAFF 240422]|uniref:Uncharacterized protein n=1 Tax=Colletotrichum orbiculare (strain 104-T / ATCC 96160 / CBS 514.97 / LARS 414 / MAFF 240422) TaxID=1213857 RepID=A0A484G5U6_COLOR|nr:hypothetical protein Cob_v000271 [Colletotrichum orbiculare MAFF 240422]
MCASQSCKSKSIPCFRLDAATWRPPLGYRARIASHSEHPCRAICPGLTAEIDLAVAQGPFQLGINDVSASLLGSINNNELLIIQAPRPVDMPDSWKERQRAALEQINRAIIHPFQTRGLTVDPSRPRSRGTSFPCRILLFGPGISLLFAQYHARLLPSNR